MTNINCTNGATLQVDLTVQELTTLISEASPSLWINITDLSIGEVTLRISAIAFYY